MEQTKEQGKKDKPFIPYGYTVKSAILGALANGTSVLQQDREGIDYSMNYVSKTVYEGVNQLYLQQMRKDHNWESPNFITHTQAQPSREAMEKNPNAVRMYFKGGEKSSVISYWNDKPRYKKNEYPIDPLTGKEDMTKEPTHKKNDLILDPVTNEPIKGQQEFAAVFNAAQINPYQFAGRKGFVTEDGKMIPSPKVAQNYPIMDKIEMVNPYVIVDKDTKRVVEAIAKPGMVYTAKDDSVMEIFKAKVSEYFNSCFTGAKFNKAEFTPEQIKELSKEIDNKDSKFLQFVTDAHLIASGNTGKLNKLEARREWKAEHQNEQKAEPAKSRGGRS